MDALTLQDGITQAGSPVELLWQQHPPAWAPPVVQPEYAGWRQEQAAWRTTVTISDLSYHMWDTFIDGPDASRLLSELSANDYRSFAIGQAKQFLPVTQEGHIVNDGILLRQGEDRYVLSGVPPAHHWVTYHAEHGDYDVEWTSDPSMEFRPGEQPELFRFQVQGPRAMDLVERAFGGPLPRTKFFHSTEVELGGRRFRALRHGMAGQPGFEFIGEYGDGAYVKDALMTAGEPLGLVHIGAMAYPTSGPESGWLPCPMPGIYTSPELADYRSDIPLFSYEGKNPLYGSYFSPDIEDYYVSPYELGYGRFISFDHDFIGRDALKAAANKVHRTKVTLVVDPADIATKLGADHGIVYTLAYHRVEADGGLVGTTASTAFVDPLGTLLSLALVDVDHAEPGTEVEIVWGAHPGPGTAPDAEFGFPRLKAIVAPSPYDEYARTSYRKN